MIAPACMAALCLGVCVSLCVQCLTSQERIRRYSVLLQRLRARVFAFGRRASLLGHDVEGLYVGRPLKDLFVRFCGTSAHAEHAQNTQCSFSHTRRIHTRDQARCLDELPELIDVIALGLSAGLSFDAALTIYCSKYNSMMSEMLNRAMRSWQLGLSDRAESLLNLARRLDVAPFTTFVYTVTESLSLGAPLAQVLTEQACMVREARRAQIEERIEKAPIKMLIPCATLILPAMLLAIMGPLFASFVSMGF